MLRRTLPALAVAALAAALPAPASADFRQVFQDFKDDGVIDACRYSDGELASVQVPPDIEQYAPAFEEALAAAREKRASGACDPKPKPREVEEAPAQPAPAAPPPPRRSRPRPQPVEIAEPPAPVERVRQAVARQVTAPPAAPALAAQRGSDAPAPVWLLAALGSLAGLIGAAALLGWWRGWSLERVTRPLGAATAEAGGRGADLAGEFWDWLRLGR